jgi:ribosomal protein S18 acetylase RimI-like enzyme
MFYESWRSMVLKEYRRKGIAKQLTLEAVVKIRKAHPIAPDAFQPTKTL